MNVIHRDIKPENMLIGDYEDLSKIKLIDFGLAVEYTKDNILDFPKCGTLLYTPPEQVAKNFMYAKKADMWAAGITMFELLTGYHPLYESGDNHQQMELKL
jgi:serine/threonine protein kinase